MQHICSHIKELFLLPNLGLSFLCCLPPGVLSFYMWKMSLKDSQMNCSCYAFIFTGTKNLQYSGDSESEVSRYFRSHDIFQRDSLLIFFLRNCETGCALVQSPMCCLEGCESFSDATEQQNI